MVTAIPSPSPYLSTLVPGGSFRGYRLLEQIGVGGQAVVWSALDEHGSCIYALKFNKILDADLNRPEELGIETKMERLVDLRHAHILPLREYGSEERVRFMVTPYIPGGTLAARIRSAPLSVQQVLQYAGEVASALDYLHSQGVIHRDLKASNILLDLSNHSYLADFGLARLISTSTLAFHTGHGTPPYSPPEQIRATEITPRSDIFSFGILLFEMLTGQLPWNGQKQLGVEQLHSNQELPDPREYVTGLPPLITQVLRRVTASDPERRPRSAGEVMAMLFRSFDVPADSLRVASSYDEQSARSRDAGQLLSHGLAQWESSGGAFQLGLTKFALVDMHKDQIETDLARQFMLAQALTYGYHDDEWWAAAGPARERLQVTSVLLKRENEVVAARILKHLAADADLLASSRGLPASIASALLGVGTKTHDSALRRRIFTGLRSLIRPGTAWQDPPLNPEYIRRLGELALDDTRLGDAVAELIGHLRSPSAVQVILSQHQDESRKIDALLLIQRVAGSLPSFVPGSVRTRLLLEWMVQRLIQQPVSLLGAYMLALLGAAMGIGIQVYLTYNLPDFLDVARFTTSLEQGLIIGSVFGVGIFAPRLIVERFEGSNAFLRLTLGTLMGGGLLTIALSIFHVLFLNTPPAGWLITAGCLLIALSFALGGLSRSRPGKMVITVFAILIAIVGTWLAHVALATSQLDLTPMFRYDYTWPLAQVLFTALCAALPIGVLANLVDLSLKSEHS